MKYDIKKILKDSKEIVYIKNGLSSLGEKKKKSFVLRKLYDLRQTEEWEDVFAYKDKKSYFIHFNGKTCYITFYLRSFQILLNQEFWNEKDCLKYQKNNIVTGQC